MAEFVMGDLGPCAVSFKGTSLGSNLSVSFTYAEDTADVKTAATGTTPIDKIYTGSSCGAVVQMTQSTLEQLEAVCPNATVTGDELMVSTGVGDAMVAEKSGKLEITRVKNGAASTDATQVITIFVAAPQPNINWTFDDSSQRVAEVTFVGFPAQEDGDSPDTYSAGDLWAIGYGETSV